MQVTVRFASLSGPLSFTRSETFATLKAATAAVTAYATAAGFSRVKLADGDPMEGYRWTATTPGGRSGRNVAFGDMDGDFTA